MNAELPTDALPVPRRVVVMGVAGCGKSTVGACLAQQLGWRFIEGDDEHSAHNVAKMAAGQALTDADRAGWLQRLSQLLHESALRGNGLVMSCSALKRAYREVLRQGDRGILFVHLHGAPDLIAARLAARQGHYMPVSLLQSQLADLQEPASDENALVLDLTLPPDRVVQTIAGHLQSPRAPFAQPA